MNQYICLFNIFLCDTVIINNSNYILLGKTYLHLLKSLFIPTNPVKCQMAMHRPLIAGCYRSNFIGKT